MLPSNQIHIDHAADMILRKGVHDVGIVGLSFKSGTDDLRESPLVTLVEKLIGKGMRLKIYDPEVRVARIMGANKRYIDEVIPHIGSLMCDSVAEAMQGSTSVVVGLTGQGIEDEVYSNCSAYQLVLDLVGLSNPEQLQGSYVGACW